MVKKRQTKRQRDIKTKLMAAICMLLVSSIMMVSTTYAWFTLSTAPEVTGINTAVGANGNLEIALMPKDAMTTDLPDYGITSAVGDSMKDIEAKNVTWGNLVDLSDSSIYGLDSITLYPAALNTTTWDADGYLATIGSTLLMTPSYGSDGRVATLNANTSNGYYDAVEKNFYPNSDMGVRAVGTASGMTERQLAYRNARSAASTAAASAKTLASQSLNANGSTLANIAIKKGTGQTTFNLDDLNSMKAIVDDLLGVHTADVNKTGSLEHIETAYKNYILAFAASAKVAPVMNADGVTESEIQPWNTVNSNMDLTLAEMYAQLSSFGVTATLPEQLTAAVNGFADTLANVTSARTQLDTLIAQGKASYEWSEISAVLYLLANPDALEVNGIKAGEIMQGDNMSNLVNSVAGSGLKVTMKTDGGVYADIADHCGDYTASVVIEEVSYNGLKLTNMTAKMETKSTVLPNYLSVVGAGVEAAGAPASSSSANQPITDMFGYVIDLAFRTNAAESNLLLQKDAVDRIYGDNANEGTMGHGSNMSFHLVNSDLTETQLKTLMGAIRLVFFTPGTDSNTVILCAKLDAANAEKDGDGVWKADLVLYKLMEDGTEVPMTDDVIMPLTQNVAHQLSVLVYLDGNLVGNDDVAASAATSMVGKLNLQFASSATLVPMDYSQLHTPNTQGGTNTPAESTPAGN